MNAVAPLHGLGGEPWSGAAPASDRYRSFLESKVVFSHFEGFEVSNDDLHQILLPHQRDIIRWAVRKGRAAIFARFGLGKTMMQLSILALIGEREGGNQLIIAPLGVRREFMNDAAKLGQTITFIRSTDEIAGPGLYMANYESVRDGKLDVLRFNAVSLDEASVLRSYGSKTYQTFLAIFADIKYRFVATATPSPNRYKELLHYAGFLGVMDTGQSLTRFFQRDSSEANNLTLYPHMEKEFYLWLHSWAVFLDKPGDLGYSDEGYDLPEMEVRYHEIRTESLVGGFESNGQGQLIRDAAMGLAGAAAVKRDSMPARAGKLAEILQADPDDHFILWHDLEAERHAIRAVVPDVTENYGMLDLTERERRVEAFSDGRVKYLSTKPKIDGSGPNFQYYCHRAVFFGIGFKFNDFIQAIHRIRRYLQTHRVIIDIIYTEDEREVLAQLQRKWAQDDALRLQMTAIIRAHGLTTDGLERELHRSIGVAREVEIGSRYQVARNDCVDETRRMASDSVDMVLTSIPFGNHYEYTECLEDFGHNPDNAAFFRQMDHLTPELLRILRPGRVAAIHVKDRIQFGNVTGYGMPTVEPFHADCTHHYIRHGFVYCGMITIVTDVVRENNGTYRLGWTEQCKDGSKMGVGSPEYVLLFRKLPTDRTKSYADVPVVKAKKEWVREGIVWDDDDQDDDEDLTDIAADDPRYANYPLERLLKNPDGYSRAQWQIDAHAFWRSNGNTFLSADELAGIGPAQLGKIFTALSGGRLYDYGEHVKIGEALDKDGRLPSKFMAIAPGSHDPQVWDDVQRMHTLNSEQSKRGLVNHICPFQIDVVDRLINRFTNRDDFVFDPFGGLFTVPVRAVTLGRKGGAAELNPDSYRDGLRHLREAEVGATSPTLFDLLGAVA